MLTRRLPSNTGREPTLLSGEQDRGDFESSNHPDCLPSVSERLMAKSFGGLHAERGDNEYFRIIQSACLISRCASGNRAPGRSGTLGVGQRITDLVLVWTQRWYVRA